MSSGFTCPWRNWARASLILPAGSGDWVPLRKSAPQAAWGQAGQGQEDSGPQVPGAVGQESPWGPHPWSHQVEGEQRPQELWAELGRGWRGHVGHQR